MTPKILIMKGRILKRITIRFENEQHAFLSLESEKEGISINSLISKIIDEYKNKNESFQKKSEVQLHEIKKLLQEVHKVSTATLLIGRENYKETAKSGFISICQAGNLDNGGGEEAVEEMNQYVSKKDEVAIKIMRGAEIL